MKQTFLLKAVILLAGAALLYLVCCFAALNWSLGQWHPVIRLAYALMLLTIVFQPLPGQLAGRDKK
jgi:hypothetical protein